jgi:FKBP-type peptidyl-prolyl cis-trans isomerase SlyD
MSPLDAQRIADGKVVSIHYTLKDGEGEILDSSEGHDPLLYLHGAGNIVPGLERGLLGRTVGEDLEVIVGPDEGYGDRDPAAIRQVPRDAFPDDVELEAGMQFMAEAPDGDVRPVWIAEVEGDVVTVDFNHPLAGTTLHFAVKVAEIRDATAEETEHGHPHGAGGHHHPH